MNDEVERIWKETIVTQFQCSPTGTEDIGLKPSVNVAAVPAAIRTQHLPNACLESYRYANPLSLKYQYAFL
jgi:hypothetical protein